MGDPMSPGEPPLAVPASIVLELEGASNPLKFAYQTSIKQAITS